MSAQLGATTYSAVTWTAGDVITEAKLDAMVANDQAYDSHSAQGLSLNNAKGYSSKLAAGTGVNVAYVDASNILHFGDSALTGEKNDTPYCDLFGILRQGFINGGCKVAQRPTAIALTTSAQFVVDRFAIYAGGTVGAGYIGQVGAITAARSSYAVYAYAVTLTGSGTINCRYRMESRDAEYYYNKLASFGLDVYHDVGSAVNYVITINKANSADNFGAVTAIGNSGNISVANQTWTPIKFENLSLADCRNGIEILVTASCGAVTNKNFYFTAFGMNAGPALLPFMPKKFDEDLRDSKRYYEKSYAYATAVGTASETDGREIGGLAGACTIGDYIYVYIPFEVEKRASCTPVVYDSTGASGKVCLRQNTSSFTTGVTGLVAAGTRSFRVGAAATATNQRSIFCHYTAEIEL